MGTIAESLNDETKKQLLVITEDNEEVPNKNASHDVEKFFTEEENHIMSLEGKEGNSIGNFKLARLADIQPGEEKLTNPYAFHVTSGKVVEMFYGIDGGSTQTRASGLSSQLLSEDDEALLRCVDDYMIIPSSYCEVPDNRAIKCASELLWDNMDTTIAPMSVDKDDKMISAPVRVVRGGKKEQVNLPEVKMDSVNQKTSVKAFYVNIIDAIGYDILTKYQNDCPSEVHVCLGVALPPDDLNPRNVELFNKYLLGRYSWSLGDQSFIISIEDVCNMTEPESAIQGMLILSETDPPEYILHIEGGGRSCGAAVLKNGTTLNPTQRTFSYGGAQLIAKLNELYIYEHGGGALKPKLLENAMITGKLKSGNTMKDIVGLVLRAKKEYAKQIADDIFREVFSKQTEVTPSDINMITLSGRLFGRGNLEYGIGDYLLAELKKRLPDTVGSIVNKNYIPFGLLVREMSILFEAE